MFLKVLLNHITGYVNIKVESFFIERFINICINKKLLLWNIKRKKSSIMYANIGIKEYKNLKEVSRKTKSRIKIQKKCGLPFLFYKYRKRKLFFTFFIIILISLIATSNFIWNIEIIGNNEISREEIIESLNNNGLRIGANKNSINTDSIINSIRLQRDDIAWIGINIKGTNAIIEVKESDKAPELVDENEYCNIISNKDAEIVKINVQNGTAAVNVGDIVKKGDVLVQRLYGRKVYRD